jgi:hypothetical protein
VLRPLPRIRDWKMGSRIRCAEKIKIAWMDK